MMDQFILNWGFLYFPEDKSTYLPAAIEMMLLFVVVFLIFKWLRKNSAKQAAEAKKLEERALEERDKRMEKEKEKENA
ncbi:hypothetical protein [Lysinibacillus sp. LZ02]|uniref:hypothetical protein n=2 Tax=unclassified Lysinibacillus TaxID=2636778 RepID=UPI0036EBF25B